MVFYIYIYIYIYRIEVVDAMEYRVQLFLVHKALEMDKLSPELVE